MSDLVNIEDAKALKRMGLPLYMPVEHRQFARESTKLSCRLWDDLATFCGRMLDYEKDPTERKPKDLDSFAEENGQRRQGAARSRQPAQGQA